MPSETEPTRSRKAAESDPSCCRSLGLAFHDITAGDNTVVFTSPSVTVTGYQAGPGGDPVTGWGTPNAQVLVPLLAH